MSTTYLDEHNCTKRFVLLTLLQPHDLKTVAPRLLIIIKIPTVSQVQP